MSSSSIRAQIAYCENRIAQLEVDISKLEMEISDADLFANECSSLLVTYIDDIDTRTRSVGNIVGVAERAALAAAYAEGMQADLSSSSITNNIDLIDIAIIKCKSIRDEKADALYTKKAELSAAQSELSNLHSQLSQAIANEEAEAAAAAAAASAAAVTNTKKR